MFSRAWKLGIGILVLATATTAFAQKGPPPGKGPGNGGGGGGHEETVGNNLSFPVIWSDGVAIPIRTGEEKFEGAYTILEEYPLIRWYHQKDLNNVWQADNTAAVPTEKFYVDVIDWGDNLEAKVWPVKTKLLRVETVLYKGLGLEAAYPEMTAYEMMRVSEETGPNEVQGAGVKSGTPMIYESEEATVYTPFARVMIQKVPDGTILENLVWTPLGWVEGSTLLDVLVDETATAEVNVGGKVIYGYNWRIGRMPEVDVGQYRITFGIEPMLGNTEFDELTEILPFGEEEEVSAEAEPTGGGVAGIDHVNNVTFIDITLTGRSGGGKPLR